MVIYQVEKTITNIWCSLVLPVASYIPLNAEDGLDALLLGDTLKLYMTR
jgi:hypothetical protein